MLIEEYCQDIKQVIAQSYIVIDSKLTIDKRSLYIGFLEGRLTFLDSSSLHFMEFVNVKTTVNCYKYSYHYQNKGETLIFRYDMAPHHQNIMTFPHHKHITNGHVVETTAPTFGKDKL